tara:strand:- start:389 stop:1543 length:1155 start_codon:yes stop_codon:yes gene_type:complete
MKLILKIILVSLLIFTFLPFVSANTNTEDFCLQNNLEYEEIRECALNLCHDDSLSVSEEEAECVFDLAKKSQEVRYCAEKYENDYECFSHFKVDELQDCETLPNEPNKFHYRCRFYLIEQIFEKIEECETFQDEFNPTENTQWKEICYRFFASKEQNEDYCDLISEGAYKQGCYDRVFRNIGEEEEGDLSFCNKIKNDYNKNRCISDYFKKNKITNPYTCLSSINRANRDSCMKMVKAEENKKKYHLLFTLPMILLLLTFFGILIFQFKKKLTLIHTAVFSLLSSGIFTILNFFSLMATKELNTLTYTLWRIINASGLILLSNSIYLQIFIFFISSFIILFILTIVIRLIIKEKPILARIISVISFLIIIYIIYLTNFSLMRFS